MEVALGCYSIRWRRMAKLILPPNDIPAKMPPLPLTGCPMYWDVVEVKPEPGYWLFVRFRDGLLARTQLRRGQLRRRSHHCWMCVFSSGIYRLRSGRLAGRSRFSAGCNVRSSRQSAMSCFRRVVKRPIRFPELSKSGSGGTRTAVIRTGEETLLAKKRQ
jgi:hypothetical protein